MVTGVNDAKSVEDSILANQEARANQTADEIPLDSDDEPITEENRVVEILDCLSEAQDDIEFADLYNATPEAAEERRKFKQYMKEYRKSMIMKKSIGPLPLNYDHVVVRNCTIAVANSIEFKNAQKNRNLKLVNVTKCNFAMPHLMLEDKDTGKIVTYQSKVSHDHFTGQTLIFRFRVKPEPDSQPQM